MKTLKYALVSALVFTTAPSAFAKPGGEAFLSSIAAMSVTDPGLGASATLGLLLTACSFEADNSQSFGACLVSPIGESAGSSKGSSNGLSSKSEKKARVEALKGELTKVIAGETEVHPAAAALVNVRIAETNGQISAPEAAAQMFKYLHEAHSN